MASDFGENVARPVDEHLRSAVALASPEKVVDVPVRKAWGYVIASDAFARLAVPAFDNSAMDGFVAHASDLAGEGPWTLPVVGDIPAGSTPMEVPAGHAARIMTGAPVPHQSGLAIVPVENTNIARGPVPLPAEVTIHKADLSRDYIRHKASNVAPGDVAAKAGTVCDAGTVAALTSLGVKTVDVYRKPTVAVISTGEELVESAAEAGEFTIPDSNRPMLATLARAYGVEDVVEYHAGDTNEDFRAILSDAAARADIIVTSGGVSVGAFDVVRAVTEPSQDMWFGPVAQRPGEPQGLGRWEGAALVCLPGNPVAAFNSFHLYVAPLIRTTAGWPAPESIAQRARISVTVSADFPRPRKPHTLFVPVRLDYQGAEVSASPFSAVGPGSHLVGSLSHTDGLAVVPFDPGSQGSPRTIDVLLTRT